MKKLVFILFFAIAFISSKSNAQVNISINVGSQPDWGPSGYDQAEYYYMPDIDSYYYVPNRQFIYISNGRWIFSSSLPARYRDYDLYRGYKVVINSPRPYNNYGEDRVRYARYRSCHSQQVIRYSRSDRNNDYNDDHDDSRRYSKYKERGNRGGEHDQDDDQGRGHRKGNRNSDGQGDH